MVVLLIERIVQFLHERGSRYTKKKKKKMNELGCRAEDTVKVTQTSGTMGEEKWRNGIVPLKASALSANPNVEICSASSRD